MSKKIGRNEPCPCGSGKKYKKCCGKNESPIFPAPLELKTGTLLDDYMMLFQGIAIYGQSILQFDKDGKELKKASDDFEKRFRSGEPNGVSVSLFMSWLHFDLRFGRTKETICERFLNSSHIKALNEPGSTLIKHLADSYCTFYKIKAVLDDWIILEELGTGEEWNVRRVNEPYEKEAKRGDIWYLRIVGVSKEAYIYTPPYIFPPEARDNFIDAARKQKEVFIKFNDKKGFTDEDIFRESCKASVHFWAEYMLKGHGDEVGKFEEHIASPSKMPELQNTDGELLRFDFDEQNNAWIWFKRGNKKIKMFPTTTLGTISIKGEYLVAETNSLNRALRLKNKLTRGFKEYLTYEKIDAKDFASMPKLSKEDMERFEKEQRELNSNPEVRKLLKEKTEDYYHNDWMKQKIPALGYKTPKQAVKTEKGRHRVEALLDSLEKTQEKMPDMPAKVDVDGLREKLGLPIKSKENHNVKKIK